MSRLWIVAGLTSLATLSTLAGGFLALRARRRLHLLLAFGAGVLAGTP